MMITKIITDLEYIEIGNWESIPIASNANWHQYCYRHRFDICINCRAYHQIIKWMDSVHYFDLNWEKKSCEFSVENCRRRFTDDVDSYSPFTSNQDKSEREQQTRKKKIQNVKRTSIQMSAHYVWCISMEKIPIFHLQFIQLIYTPNEELQWEFVKLVNWIQNR